MGFAELFWLLLVRQIDKVLTSLLVKLAFHEDVEEKRDGSVVVELKVDVYGPE